MASQKRILKSFVFIIVMVLAALIVCGCTTQSVRIIFDTDGGDEIKPIIISPDTTFVRLPDPPSKEGYDFAGWYLNEERTIAFNPSEVPTETITLYAAWEPRELTITFRASMITQPTYEYIYRTIPYGESLANYMPSVPEREGYEGHWDLNNIDIRNITESYVINAVYTLRTYNMTFITDEQKEPYHIVSGYMNQAYEIPEDPVRDGYYFGGWYYDPNFNTPYIFPDVMPSSDVTLYAWWVSQNQIRDYYLFERADYEGGVDNAIRIIDITRAAIYLTNMLVPAQIDGIPVRYIGYDTPYDQINNKEALDAHSVFNTSSLRNIFIANTVKYIGSMAFSQTSELSVVRFEKNSQLTKICDAAFMGCTRIQQISLPSSLETIGDYAFAFDSQSGRDMLLSKVNIENNSNLSQIGEGAFSGCMMLEEFFIPRSMTSINYLSFKDANIRAFTVAENHEQFSDNDGVIFSLDNETLIYFPNRGGIHRGVDSLGNPLFEYVVPMTTRFIGPNAFRGNINLTSVTITSMVSVIGEYAFYNMPNLQGVNFVENSQLQVIGDYAFSGAHKVKRIVLPQGTLATIGASAFSSIGDELMGLEEINLSEGLWNIGHSAFKNCAYLRDVTIPASVQVIGDYAFYNCRYLIVDFITAGSQLNSIGDYAFYRNFSIRDILLPASLVSIGDYAFAAEEGDSMNLTTLNVDIDSEGNRLLETIGEGAFSNCSSLLYFTVPEKVETIGAKAFYNCSSLMITFNRYNNVLKRIEPYTFYRNTNLTQIEFPYSVESIGDYAFYGCVNLNSIQSGSISNPSLVKSIGISAFENCRQLQSGHEENKRLLFPITETVGERAFFDCQSLTNITLVNSLETVGKEAFAQCINLTDIAWGSSPSLKVLPNNLFEGCTSLQNFRIASSIESIEGNPFSNCSSLIGFTADSSNQYYKTEDNQGINVLYNKLGERTIALFPSGRSVAFQIPADVEQIAPYAFYTSRITSLTFAEGAALDIGDYAFSNNSYLTQVVISKRVKTIGEYAFNNCRYLSMITIDPDEDEDSNLIIGDYAFSHNSISEIIIPERVTIIGKYAFWGSYNLLNIEFDQSDSEKSLTIDDYAFYECSRITQLVFPSRLEEIKDFAFSWCVGLSDLVFAASDTKLELGRYVFDNCHMLREVVLPNRLTDMGSHIFANCYNLKRMEFESLQGIVFKEGGVEMGANIFENCNELRTVVIPSHFVKIGDYAFYGCQSIEDLVFLEGEMDLSIGKYAFSYCSAIDKFTIPARTTFIDDYAFYKSGLGSAALNAFKDGMSVIAYRQDLMFEDGEKELIIGEYSFADTNLFYVYLPQRVSQILSYAFKDNRNLMLFEFSDNSECVYIGEGAFENIGYGTIQNSNLNFKELTGYDRYALSEDIRIFALPDSVIEIGEYVFRNSSALREIILNEGLVTISQGAFYGCRGLTFITIPSTVEYIGDYAFYNCINLQNVEISIDGAYTLGSYSFSGCKSLTSLSLRMVSMIGDAPAYGCDNLELLEVDIQNPYYKTMNNVLYTKNVEYDSQPYGEDQLLILYPAGKQGSTYSISKNTIELGSKAFSGNRFLKSILIDVDETGGSVLIISEDTFENTAPELEFYVGGGMEYVYRQNIMWRTYTERIRSSSLSVENFIIEILPGDSESCRIIKYIGLAEAGDNLVIPSTIRGLRVKEIGQNAFSYNAILKTVRIPQGVTKIADRAFYNNVSLERVIISDSVQHIGEHAFYGCSSLIDVQLGDNSLLTTISNYAFQNCVSLETIRLPWRLRTIGMYSFAGSKDNQMALKEITFRKSLDNEISLLESIGNYAFQYCSQLSTITLPDSVTHLGTRIFNHCSSLTSVVVERGVNQSLTQLQNNDVFANTPKELMIYVYDAIKHEYIKARYWRNLAEKIDSIETLRDEYSIEIINKAYHAVNIVDYLGVLNQSTSEFEDLREELKLPETLNKKPLGYADYEQKTFTHFINDFDYTLEFKSYQTNNLRPILLYDELGREHTVMVEDVVFVLEGVRILKYLGAERNISLPAELQGLPVLEIGGYSFNYKLNSIQIPEGVLEIGDNAFRYSSSLASVNLPLSLIRIGNYAFYDTNISNLVFSNNTIEALNSSRLREIGNYAFYSNTLLGQVTVPPLVDRIGDYAFGSDGKRMQLEDVKFLGEEMIEIGRFAFAKTNIRTITLPSRLENIKDGVFKDCEYLVSVYMNDDSDTSRIVNLENQATSLFENCDFVKVYVMDNKLAYYRNNENWSRYGSRILSWDSMYDDFVISIIDSTNMIAELVHYLGENKDVVIPPMIGNYTIKSIGTYVFDYTIDSVTIPNTVETIRNYAFYKSSISQVIFESGSNLNTIEQYAFYGTGLESIVIPSSVGNINNHAFANTPLSSIEFEDIDSLPDQDIPALILASYCFSENHNLEEIQLPSRLYQIQEYAFYNNENLREVIFYDGILTVIENFAFAKCSSLIEIVIPYSVEALYNGVFSECTSLSEVYIMRGRDSSSSPTVPLTTAGAGLFNNVNNPFLKIYVPRYSLDGYRTMENWRVYAGYNEGGVPDPLVYPDYIIPNLISGDYAYTILDGGSIQLNKYRGEEVQLVIPAQMEIGGVSYSVKSIGRHFGNPFIKSVRLEAGYDQKINMFGFSDCVSLERVVLPNTIRDTGIGEYAFRNCYNLRTINLPADITEILQGTFQSCVSLKEIDIPYNVQFIRAFAFNGCSSLNRVYITRDRVEGGSSMFMNTPSALRVLVNPNHLSDYRTRTLWAEMGNQIIPNTTLYGSYAIEELQNQRIRILQFTGNTKAVYIPEYIQGKRVYEIVSHAFVDSVETIYLPEGSEIIYSNDIADKIVFI